MSKDKILNNKYIKNICAVFFAILSVVALTVTFDELPGHYSILKMLGMVCLCCFFIYVEAKNYKSDYVLLIPAFGTAFFYLVGRCFYVYNESLMIWGSKLRCLYFMLCLIGLTYLFYHVYLWISNLFTHLETGGKTYEKLDKFFFSKFCTVKSAVVIWLFWGPVIFYSYPGGYCGDSSYQMQQAIGRYPYNTIHPLTHTLFLKLFLNIGNNILGSYNRGLFLQIIVQSITMALVLGYSIRVLTRFNVNRLYLLFIMAIYALAPLYPNFASMTVKDSLFNTWILLYFVFLAEFIWAKEESITLKRSLQIVTAAVLVMLFRNNGPIVVFCASVGLTVYFASRKDIKKSARFSGILVYAVLPLVLFLIINKSLIYALDADTINGKEVLSMPFQQTGRYARDYADEVTEEEWEAIGRVINNSTRFIGYVYDPNISDPLKVLYNNDATAGDVAAYLKVWFTMFFKHPGVYFDAFFNMCYGWFDVGLHNNIRYPGDLSIFYPPRWGDNSENVLNWLDTLDRNPVTGTFNKIGVYVWWMTLVIIYLWKNKERDKNLIFMLPLFVSLLVCIASPACLLHPRYAFPIVFTMPFLTGALIKKKKNSKRAI